MLSDDLVLGVQGTDGDQVTKQTKYHNVACFYEKCGSV